MLYVITVPCINHGILYHVSRSKGSTRYTVHLPGLYELYD